MISSQRVLIDYLQQSNEDYIRKFERLQLQIETADWSDKEISVGSCSISPGTPYSSQTVSFVSQSPMETINRNILPLPPDERNAVAFPRAENAEEGILLNILGH